MNAIPATRRPHWADDAHLIATLFLGSGAAAVVMAVADVCALARVAEVGRIRELELLLSLRLLFEDGTNVNLAGHFPAIFSHAFELNAFMPLATFLALSIAATLVFFWGVAAMLVPVLMIARRLIPRTSGYRLGNWFWERAFPLAVVIGFAVPAILVPVRARFIARRPTILAITLATAFVIWLVLLLVLRRPERIARFLRVTAASCLAFAAIVWVAATIAVAFEPRPVQPPATGGSPNVLLVSIDSLRRDHLHCYDYPRETSPAIDTVARDGVAFRTVVAPTSWTLPSHLTLLTALPPEQHGVVRDGARLGDDAVLLSQVLWEAGYTTAGFVSAPYLDAVYGYSRGFDHYDDYTIVKRSLPASHRGVTSPTLIHIVSEWLDEWDRGGRQRPFFAFVHMWDVHYDYTPPPPYDSMFDPDYRGPITGENFQDDPNIHLGMNPRDLEHLIALYDGEIRFTDLHLGYLLDHLRRLGVLDNTVVVVTADHGDEFFEHGRKGHKQDLYDETLLVPLVIRYPAKVPAGIRVTSQVRLMDIPVTILALAGVVRPPAFGASAVAVPHAARDLTPWISGAANTLPELPAFSDLIGDAPVPVASIRTATAKLIQEQRGATKEELYDLASDPGERMNIIAQDAAVSAPLRTELSAWRDACRAGAKRSEKANLSEAHKERLRELGYGE